MNTRAIGLAVVLSGALSGTLSAQNFLDNSAETINKGNFKIAGFPTVLIGEDGGDSEWGLATRVGYGFSNMFDVEAKAAFFDGLTLWGADGEIWMLKGPVNLSASLGFHKASFDVGADSTAVDVSGILSGKLTDKLEWYGGVNLSFESLDDSDVDFTRVHVVPGIEYKLHQDLDLVAEFGIGLNDDSPNYFNVGLAYYIR